MSRAPLPVLGDVLAILDALPFVVLALGIVGAVALTDCGREPTNQPSHGCECSGSTKRR